MTTHVAMPLSDEYIKLSTDIVEKLQDKKSSSQAERTVKTTRLLIDEMFEIMVDDLIDQVPMKPFAHKLIHQVSVVVHKAVNVLVSKVIGKLNNKELKPVVMHFKNLELEREGKRYLGFQLDDKSEALIYSCIAHLEEGNIEACKTELVDVLETVIEQSIDLFLLDTMSLVKLGLISRKLVDLTHATIDKAVPPALHKIIDHMNQEELEHLKDFLLSLLIMED